MDSNDRNPNDRRWLREWALRIGGTAYLLFVFAFLVGHPRPGSIDSLTHALGMAVVPALIGTLAALAVMLYLRRR
ncbi:hypothetical protein [Pelagibius sp.]|uniref:hypothetical protein n=1 Tax=Pelagibius sp. TaxID=1931238 RepID=UPI003B50C730